MRAMKAILPVLVVFSLLFTLTGCGTEETQIEALSDTDHSELSVFSVDDSEAVSESADISEEDEASAPETSNDFTLDEDGTSDDSENSSSSIYESPTIDGPPYSYDIAGISVSCNINIYDYIYEKNGDLWVDIIQMNADVGYQPGIDEQYYWGTPTFCDVDGGQAIISMTYHLTEHGGEQTFIEVQMADFGPGNLASYAVKKMSSDECIYRLKSRTNYAMSLEQIELWAYMLDTARQQGSALSPGPLGTLPQNNSGMYVLD